MSVEWLSANLDEGVQQRIEKLGYSLRDWHQLYVRWRRAQNMHLKPKMITYDPDRIKVFLEEQEAQKAYRRVPS